MKPVLLTPQARDEIEAAARWYEQKRQGLGAEFYDRAQEAIEKVELNPQGYAPIYKDLRRSALRQFEDWALWFRIMPDNSVVVACLSAGAIPFWRKSELQLSVRFRHSSVDNQPSAGPAIICLLCH